MRYFSLLFLKKKNKFKIAQCQAGNLNPKAAFFFFVPRVILVQVHYYYTIIGIQFNSKQVLVFLEVQAGK